MLFSPSPSASVPSPAFRSPDYVAIAATVAKRAPTTQRDLRDTCLSVVAQYYVTSEFNPRHASLVKALLRDKSLVRLIRI